MAMDDTGNLPPAGEAGGDAAAPVPAAGPESALADRLETALAGTGAPAWRKAYLANLIASGRRFAGAGNARGADYCFAKVEEAIRAMPAAPPAPVAEASADRPAERIGRQWRLDRIGHAEKVLDSHGSRLSQVEKNAYREKLAKLKADAERPSQSVRADAGLLDLRRRLYQRVLKAQKVSLLRKRAPAARPALPARVSATHAAWQPVTGPYNDRSNLEGILDLIGAADPAWVEEFLELYGALGGLEALIGAAGTAKK